MRANRADSMYAFAPDVQIGRAQTWNVGFQRAITKDMAVEIRYVGTKGTNQWSELDWNGIRGENLVANGFMNEFKAAMTNLAANNAAGGSRAGSFAYFGPGTGTNPAAHLPGLLQRPDRLDESSRLHRRDLERGRARRSRPGCRRPTRHP